MAWQVVNLPNLVLVGTSAGAFTNAIGSLDDAESITFFMVSTAAATSTGAAGILLQVSQFDPAVTAPGGVTQSTGFNTLSSTIFSTGAGLLTSSGYAITVTNVAYRGLRLSGYSSGTDGELIARVCKSILV